MKVWNGNYILFFLCIFSYSTMLILIKYNHSLFSEEVRRTILSLFQCVVLFFIIILLPVYTKNIGLLSFIGLLTFFYLLFVIMKTFSGERISDAGIRITDDPDDLQRFIAKEEVTVFDSSFREMSNCDAPLFTKKTEKILIIDDDPVSITILKKCFEASGYHLFSAKNGADGLELMKRYEFDILLLDIMLPDISGYEVCRIIRKNYSQDELPILFLTARNEIQDLVTGFNAGGNDYISKPVNREELMIRVKNLVDLKKAVKKNMETNQRLMQERMTPHFIFNTLNSIHAYLHFDVEKADGALLQLADCYRFLTNHSYEPLVKFEDEWAFVEHYLEIKKIQHEDVLNYDVVFEGDFSELYIPPLTIQPLIENSFKHGFSKKKSDWNITISVRRIGTRLSISICDNGAGMSGEINLLRSSGTIQDRINYYFRDVEFIIENNDSAGVKTLLSFDVSV